MIFVLTQKNTQRYGLRSIHYQGSKCWNDTTVDIKQSYDIIYYLEVFPQ